MTNAVFHFNLNSRCLFVKNVCNKDISYEPELFPAALISKWAPIHITLFPNGKGIITGVRSRSQASKVLEKLMLYLKKINVNADLH